MSPERLAGESLGLDLREEPPADATPKPDKPATPGSDPERPVVLCPCPRPGMYQRCFRFPCIYAENSAYKPPF